MRKKSYKELSPEIQNLLIERTRQNLASKTLTECLEILKSSVTSGFIFMKTPEGYNFWREALFEENKKNSNNLKKSIMKWKKLNKEIQEEILEEQVRQGNDKDEKVFINNIITGRGLGGFDWQSSVKGYNYWGIRLTSKNDPKEDFLEFIDELS